MSSKKFTEQIRQLEEEGAKLLAATHSLGDSLHVDDGRQTEGRNYRPRAMTPELTALTDITAEQKTISDLRKNLDDQCKETERLHKELFNTSSSKPYREPVRPSNLANLEIPLTSHHSPSYSTNVAAQNRSYSNPKDFSSYNGINADSRLLEESRREVNELRSRLKEALSISEQQKAHFRSTIEDLRSQLHTAVAGKDTLLQKSKRVAGDKDLAIERLQETVDQLERANRLQEETLLEMNEKLESLQKDQYMIDTSVAQIRSLLQEREHRRGHPFYENEPVSKQSITVLAHTVERCMQDLEFEAKQKQDKIDQLMLEVDDVKASSQRKEDQLILDQERKLTRLQDERDREVLKLTDQYTHYKDEAMLLQDKSTTLEKQMEQQMRVREEQMIDLEKRMHALRQETDIERRSWMEKRSALEMALDESQKEAALLKGERDASVRKAAQIESRFMDMQNLIDKLNLDLAEERDKGRQFADKEGQSRAMEERYNIQLKHKDQLLCEMEQKLKIIRQEADAQIQSTVSNMEKEGKAYVQKEISSLKMQIEAMTDKCHKMQLELEVTKSERKNLEEKYTETKESLIKTTTQLEQANMKKENLSTLLSEKVNDVERVTQEKDYYFKLIDERSQEISTLKALKEKLTIQLEEREKNFLALQQQNDKMQDFMGENTKSSTELRVEKDSLQQKFNEKIIEVEEVRKLRDQLAKKVRAKEKRVQELEEENNQLIAEIGGRKAEVGTVTRERDKIHDELRQSRYEVAALNEEKQTLEKQLHDKEGDLGKELTKLTKKLKSSEQDLRLAKKALKTREDVDGKAVKVAGKMQKEVTEKRGQIDTLQTRIRWLEECLDAAIKDKGTVKEENEKLTASIFKLGKQSERLSQELQNHLTKNKQLKEKITMLESALEKAAVKNAASQAQVEEQQQEMARLQLKHQLQLKEMNRNGNIKNFYNPVEQSKPQSTLTAKSFKLPRPLIMTTASDLEEKPVRDKPAKESSGSPSGDSAVGDELRHLLNEMRTLIQTGQKKQTLQEKFHPNESTVFSDSELEPRGSHRVKAVKDKKKHRSSHRKVKDKERSRSPVSDLLMSSLYHDEALSDTVLSPASLDESEDVSCSSYKHKPTKVRRPPLIRPESEDVRKRLEKKIESLSKIGTQLQQDNKEIARVMKDQDKRLKKVKTQIVK